MQVNIRQLVKECILEVLKENLLEGFDPTSAGPNPASTEQTQHDPYKAWNAKMRKMEEAASKSRYQYKASRESVEKTKRELIQILTQYKGKIQVDLVSTKPVTYGVRFDLFILGYPPGYTGNTYGINQEEWNNLGEVVSAKVTKLLPGATLYTDPWSDSRKFHIRFETYIQTFDPQLKESDPHGRYVQMAGAGQFDQRTFGVNEADKKENIIYKEIQNGKDIYWVEDKETGGTTALSPLAIADFIRQGYKIVELDSDPRSAIRQPDPDMANYMGDGDRT